MVRKRTQLGCIQTRADGAATRAHGSRLLTRATEASCSLDVQSVMWAFHAARTNCASARLSAPSCVRKSAFSAVTKRSSRATDGLANPAAFQSASVTSTALRRHDEVSRQITASAPKSKRTSAGRGLLKSPEVKGKRQMKTSPNFIGRNRRRRLRSRRPS